MAESWQRKKSIGGRDGSADTAKRINRFPARVAKCNTRRMKKKKTRKRNSSENPSSRNSMLEDVWLLLSMQLTTDIRPARGKKNETREYKSRWKDTSNHLPIPSSLLVVVQVPMEN